MKIAWLLLFTLLLVYLLDPADCWRRRRFRLRVRVRARRIVPRIRVRRVIPRIRVRRVIPRIRVRRVLPRIRIRRVLPRINIPRLRVRLSGILNRRRYIPSPITRTPAPPLYTQAPNQNTTVATPNPCPEICAGECPTRCSSWNCPCQWVCSSICDWFTEEEFIWPYSGYAIPLPCDFEQYDGDNDGGISPAELAFMVRMRSRDENNLVVFNKMDLDQDGNVTSGEFNSFLLLKDCESVEEQMTTQTVQISLSKK